MTDVPFSRPPVAVACSSTRLHGRRAPGRSVLRGVLFEEPERARLAANAMPEAPGDPRLSTGTVAIVLVLAAGLAASSLARAADGVWGGSLDRRIETTALAVDPKTPTTVYAGTQLGVFKTTDGGRRWRSMGAGLGRKRVLALAIDPQKPATIYVVADFGVHASKSGVFKTTNGGGSWRAVNTGLGLNSSARTLAIDPQTPAIVYTGTGGGVFKSSDGGRSWSVLSASPKHVFALALDPQTPTTLYAGTFGSGAFKSIDGGGSWQPVNARLTAALGFIQELAIDPQTPATVYAGTTTGVFKTTDGGQRWIAMPDRQIVSVRALAVDPGAPTTVYAGLITGGGVFKSTNGGRKWRAAGVDRRQVWELAINPRKPATLYAGTGGNGVFKSTNGGRSWRGVNAGLVRT